VSDWLRLFPCKQAKNHHADLAKVRLTLDIGSHSNAGGERRPTGTEPRRRTEPVLWAIRSTGWLGTVTENAPITATLPKPSRN
jgi:hypothetical protein